MQGNIPVELIQRYSTSGPRYTSYPTAMELKEDFPKTAWKEALLRRAAQPDFESLSIYVHIPFCPSLCYFCACNKVITKRKDIIERYLGTLTGEIQGYNIPALQKSPVTQLHFGGGSPSYLEADQFMGIFETLRSVFPNITPDAEISIEVDPRTVDRNKLSFYRKCGFSRISLGVQDFDPEVQELINREQPFEMTRAVLQDATELGFTGTNVDLIYGLPGQREASFLKTIEQLKSLRPDRVALYGYAHVPWVKKVQKVLEQAHLPSPQERLQLFLIALKALSEAGYIHIGMDHFALPTDELAVALQKGSLFRNFMGYTVQRSDTILAFGTSAISSLPTMLVQNYKDLDEYNEAVEKDGAALERGCLKSSDDQVRADVIQSLFCQMKLSIPALERKWSISFWDYFGDARQKLAVFEKDGIIAVSPEEIRVTDLGRFFIRNIAMIFDAYLTKYKGSEKPVFSQSV